jgi:hypothetical protein
VSHQALISRAVTCTACSPLKKLPPSVWFSSVVQVEVKSVPPTLRTTASCPMALCLTRATPHREMVPEWLPGAGDAQKLAECESLCEPPTHGQARQKKSVIGTAGTAVGACVRAAAARRVRMHLRRAQSHHVAHLLTVRPSPAGYMEGEVL